jgi:actin-related protein
MDLKDEYVGEEAQSKRGILAITHPFERGIVTDWGAVEKIWQFIYERELDVIPDDHPVLLTEPALNPKANREKMTQIMFETFNTPAMYLAVQAVLALHSTGASTGIVFDCGEQAANIVPVYEGSALSHAIMRTELAGQDITDYLCRLLSERGHVFASSSEREVGRDIKEKLAYVAEDFTDEALKVEESPSFANRNYELPDGQTLVVGPERFRCTEALFHPSHVGRAMHGAAKHLAAAIGRCDIDIRRDLFENVVLAGGTTLCPGIDIRMAKELTSLAPPATKVNVVAPANRRHAVWVGGSILASMPSFLGSCVSREDYDEVGASIVHRKCF